MASRLCTSYPNNPGKKMAIIFAALLVMVSSIATTRAQQPQLMNWPDSLTFTPDDATQRFVDQMPATALGADWTAATAMAVLNDLDGDNVDEIALGSATLQRVIIVKLPSKESRTQTVTSTISATSVFGGPATGKEFGKTIVALNYDFNGDATKDIVVGAPNTATWEDGRLVIVCVDSALLFVESKVYTPLEWCPTCASTSASGQFAYALTVQKVWDTNCLLVFTGTAFVQTQCGVTSANPTTTVSSKQALLEMSAPYSNYDYHAFTAFGDIDDDGVEEFTYRSELDLVFVIGALPDLPVRDVYSVWQSGYRTLRLDTAPTATGAPGDINGDGIPDLAFQTLTADGANTNWGVSFLYMDRNGPVREAFNGTHTNVHTLAKILHLGETPGGALAFSRRGGLSSLYAYYIIANTGAVSGIYAGAILPEENPTQESDYILTPGLVANVIRNKYTASSLGSATAFGFHANDKKPIPRIFYVGDVTGDGVEEFAISDGNTWDALATAKNLYVFTPSASSTPFKVNGPELFEDTSAGFHFARSVMPTNEDFNGDGANDLAASVFSDNIAAGKRPGVVVICLRSSSITASALEMVFGPSATSFSDYSRWNPSDTSPSMSEFGKIDAAAVLVRGQTYLIFALGRQPDSNEFHRGLLAGKAADMALPTMQTSRVTPATDVDFGPFINSKFSWALEPRIDLTTIGDLDDDCVDETVMTNGFEVYVFFWDPQAPAGVPRKQSSQAFPTPAQQSTSKSIASMAGIGDVNADGVPDLAITLRGEGRDGSMTIIYLNTQGQSTSIDKPPIWPTKVHKALFEFNLAASPVTHRIVYFSQQGFTVNVLDVAFLNPPVKTACNYKTHTPTPTPTPTATPTLTAEIVPPGCGYEHKVGVNPWVQWSVFNMDTNVDANANAAKEYFRRRTEHYRRQVQAANDRITMRVNVHGTKLNVLDTTVSLFSRVKKIVLEGDAAGLVIISVEGWGALELQQGINVVQVVNGQEVALTFGRVLVSLPDVTTLSMSNIAATGGITTTTQLSIVAPNADALFMSGVLTGNLIVKSLSQSPFATVAPQPFGKVPGSNPITPAPANCPFCAQCQWGAL